MLGYIYWVNRKETKHNTIKRVVARKIISFQIKITLFVSVCVCICSEQWISIILFSSLWGKEQRTTPVNARVFLLAEKKKKIQFDLIISTKTKQQHKKERKRKDHVLPSPRKQSDLGFCFFNRLLWWKSIVILINYLFVHFSFALICFLDYKCDINSL